MGILDTLWVTFVATLVATVIGVYVGILLERRHAEKDQAAKMQDDKAKARSRYTESLVELAAPGGVLYDTRDWGRSLGTDADQGRLLGAQTYNYGSIRALQGLLSAGLVPKAHLVDYLALVGRVEELQRYLDKWLLSVVPQPAAVHVQQCAEAVAHLAQSLIRDFQGKRGVGIDSELFDGPTLAAALDA